MPHKVTISRLKLHDFRNYASIVLDLDRRHVVLTGSNGAGKTNLMEAVSFLSPGRGLRRAAYADVVREGAAGGFSVFAAVDGMQGEVDIGTGTEGGEEGQSRRLRLNGTPARAVNGTSTYDAGAAAGVVTFGMPLSAFTSASPLAADASAAIVQLPCSATGGRRPA